ncbi:MAG: pyruvate kinase [Myxococcota bacterium]
MRRAKIVCTLGPASEDEETIDALVAAGMDCARLNFSHGDHAWHAAVAARVREAARRAGRPLALLGDLTGPKMRIGPIADGEVQLAEGDRLTLTTREVAGDTRQVSVSYAELPRDVRPGDPILLDDGLLRLRVVDVQDTDVITEVEIGGPLSGRKGVNLPGVRVGTPAITDKDQRDLRFAVEELGVDYLALSFVRSPQDVAKAKALAGDVPVIAKVEKPEAVERLEAIADAADGVMVARGDLGVEVGAEKVPLLQKRIIRTVNERGKIVITATQMLDSMIRNPRPTRAEAADVANAVIDGTDAVMLSGETAAGRYPLPAIRMMDAIVREVEDEWLEPMARQVRELRLVEAEEWSFPTAAARAATLMASALPLKAVVTFTRDGRSAALVAEYRSRAPIVAVTSDPRVARRLALDWGVVPRVEVPPDDLEEAVRLCTALLVREGICTKGDPFAMVLAWPPSGRTNTVKLHRV